MIQNGESFNSLYFEQIRFKGKNVKIQSKIKWFTSIDLGNAKQVNNLNSDGGAIQCYNCISFYAEGLNVQDSKAMSGGAISFEET